MQMRNKSYWEESLGVSASFLLGWLVYGVLFMDYMNANYNQCAMKPMEEMVWWALILSNFASGFLLAIIFRLVKYPWLDGRGKSRRYRSLFYDYFLRSQFLFDEQYVQWIERSNC